MGRLREELTEPWGLLVAGVAGGVAWAAAGPVLAGLGVGAAVYGIKVGLGALTGRDTGPERPRGPVDREVRAWLDRADSAVRALQGMAAAGAGSSVDAAAAEAASGAAAVQQSMERLAGQTVAVGVALGRADAVGLDEEAARLAGHAAQRPHDVSAQSSASAIADRVAVRDRLQRTRAVLHGRLEASALGLEGLVARLAELQVAASTVGEVDPTSRDLAELTTEVEGLRRGLAEAEQATRAALGPQDP